MARFHLRLTDPEFFRLTPRQLHLLVARHREEAEHREYLSAIIAATIANFSFSPPKKPVRPSDFMPSFRSRAKPSPKKRLPRQTIAQNVRCFLQARLSAPTPEK